MQKFPALVAHQDGDQISARVQTQADPPPGEVTIRVLDSSVNFKDALALTPGGGVVRRYSVVPGIDLTGEVIDSQSSDFAVGDAVVTHGYQIGTAGQVVCLDRELWARLGGALRPRHLDAITTEVDVKDVVGVLDQVRPELSPDGPSYGLPTGSEPEVG